MFGIGLGEILLILFVAFLINPRELPALMRRISKFINYMRSMKEYFMEIEDNVGEILKEGKLDTESFKEDIPEEFWKKERIADREKRRGNTKEQLGSKREKANRDTESTQKKKE